MTNKPSQDIFSAAMVRDHLLCGAAICTCGRSFQLGDLLALPSAADVWTAPEVIRCPNCQRDCKSKVLQHLLECPVGTIQPEPPKASPPPLHLTERLKPHADCEIGLCFTCNDVWTGKELIPFSPDAEDKSSSEKTHCPRCGANLELEALRHVLRCPLSSPTQQGATPAEPDIFTQKIEQLDEDMRRLSQEAVGLNDPLQAVLTMQFLIQVLTLQVLNSIRLGLKE